MKIHIHPEDGSPIQATSLGQIEDSSVRLTHEQMAGQRRLELKIS